MLSDAQILNLFSSACPSIQFRVSSEILKLHLCPDEKNYYQTQILKDPLVKEVLAAQNEDGWFCSRFHGYNSHESCIRILLEKGINLVYPAMIRAMDALERDTKRIAADLGSFGRYFDAHRLGGARMIQASLLAQGGRNNNPIVTEQVEVALEGLQSVLTVDSFEEATEMKHGQLVFKATMQWPGIYHLRLLAYTQTWRTAENMRRVEESINKMVSFSPMPYAHVLSGSQMIAPAAFAMLDFNPDLDTFDPSGWMMWFHRTELLSRLGILTKIPKLINQINKMQQLLDIKDGKFSLPLRHDSFTRWGAYTGLMLEPDWKKAQRRIHDLTFRCYSILSKIDH